MGGKNANFRATVIHEAAKAVQNPLRHWGFPSAVGADLAWYLLLDSPIAIKQWKLDIHIPVHQQYLLTLAQRLSAVDARFHIPNGWQTPTVMVYTHNVLNNGSALKKRNCEITLISRGDIKWGHLMEVKAITILPLKALLFERMQAYSAVSSHAETERRIFQDVAAAKAYAALFRTIEPHNLPPQHEEVFLRTLLEKMCALIPDAKETFETLHLLPSGAPEPRVPTVSMISLSVTDNVVDARARSQSSCSSSSISPRASTSLAVGAKTSTPPTSPVSPVIPARGFRAVVFRAVKEVTRIFREEGFTFAILGSTACYLYGNKRLPNDVDILISSHTCDIESLKEFLVGKNSARFYLVDAKTPGATWKVLWYHDRSVDGKLEKTKVDILKPGVLQLPMIFSEAIVDKQGLPVVPLSILLLHKLKGWEDNMESTEPHLQDKELADASDILSLLVILFKGMSAQEMKNSKYWKRFALERFDEEFRGETERQVDLFSLSFPVSQPLWKVLGW